MIEPTVKNQLLALFGTRLQENAPLAGYTTAQIGGPADVLIVLHNRLELEQAVRLLWQSAIPFTILGSASNVLISDDGLRGVALINKAKQVEFDLSGDKVAVRAESGAILSSIARQAALQGLTGLEWAAAVPGTLGGAVYGNAGAHGRDMAANLSVAEILHPVNGVEQWSVQRMEYSYRSSALKRTGEKVVILSALLHLDRDNPQDIKGRMEEYTAHRRRTQPPGASMGSMFKNPAGDFAGRLIEAAGLKGLRIGGAEVSPVHGNFFVNHSRATASDIFQLIRRVQKTVNERFGVMLELEVELLGSYDFAEELKG